MQLPVTTTEDLPIPDISGPPGVDLSLYTPQVALVADPNSNPGGEPLDTDYHGGSWLVTPTITQKGTAGLRVGPGGVQFAEGFYMAWVRIVTSTLDVRIKAGRVRVGDPRQ